MRCSYRVSSIQIHLSRITYSQEVSFGRRTGDLSSYGNARAVFFHAFNIRRNFYVHSHGNLQRDLFFWSLAPRRSLPRTLERSSAIFAKLPLRRTRQLFLAKRWFIWQRKNTLMCFICSRKANVGKLHRHVIFSA